VLVASRPYAEELARRLDVAVRPFLQFTDAGRFHPRRNEARAHTLLFVGNWRGRFRPVVWEAVRSGRELALYGQGWRHLAPGHALADYVPNEELPELYSSCEILLNDHWQEMRELGFIANRVFDALACEAFVLSDDSEALLEVLGGGLDTYRSAEELEEKIAFYLDNPARRREVARRGRAIVLREHTVEHRAEQLLEAVRDAAGTAGRAQLDHLREATRSPATGSRGGPSGRIPLQD
jgi:glycosyltransferase involved in cell wall biosynthesis